MKKSEHLMTIGCVFFRKWWWIMGWTDKKDLITLKQ
jgi:hypothetical protein